MILSLLMLAAAKSVSYWITQIVFVVGGGAFCTAGGFAMKNKDPNSSITPGKAMALVIVGGIAVIVGLFFVSYIVPY